MNIGVQVVNASRVKDGNLQDVKTDKDGKPILARDEDGNIIYQKDKDGNFIYRIKTDANGNPVPKEIKTVILFIQIHLQLMITATRYIRLTKTETISLKKMPTAMCLRMKTDILFMSRNMSLST